MEGQKKPRRRRKPVEYEIQLVPTEAGLPPGDSNPYRYMNEDEREALLIRSLARILVDTTRPEVAGQPSPTTDKDETTTGSS